MALFFATVASVRAILSAKDIRNPLADIELCCGGAADLLGPSDGVGGAGDSVVVTGTADDAI